MSYSTATQQPVNGCVQNHSTGDYLTVAEFAREFGMCEQQAYRLTRSNRVPHCRIGGRIYIHRDTLNVWLLSQQITSTERSTHV